eukprot:TRINITY_DN1121_c0_g1_i3.p1 TRINITY_DN1121_c0_g1~~TRINITY_DN1121_c0_g1_i3.p1  ORF type:complete len:572 (-),score=145.26 TRINITY_DN1121_c0_g1_i3:181-1896(-)
MHNILSIKPMRMMVTTTIMMMLLVGVVYCEYQSMDGSGNNVNNPKWGQAHQPFSRLAPINYADGFGHPTGGPNSRSISNIVFSNTTLVDSSLNLTHYSLIWGQIVAHELAFAKTASTEPWPIRVPECDEVFDPTCSGSKKFTISRTPYTNLSTHREQLSAVSTFIDANLYYGTDLAWIQVTRTKEKGRLHSQNLEGVGEMPYRNRALLPLTNDDTIVPTNDLFAIGEQRGNENPQLLAIHILFLREHNRLASLFSSRHPLWNDEQLFQSARRCVIAYSQKITYDEWIPAFLGTSVGSYPGYDDTLLPTTSNEFTTAAFRYGHSMLDGTINRWDADGNTINEGDLSMKNSFFNPSNMDVGLEPYFRGMMAPSLEIDTSMIDEVRNFLFGAPGSATGFDLASRNIERGRDHGLAYYNTVRKAIGLTSVTSFSDITSNPTVQQNLIDAYGGDLEIIDLWVGGLAEDHVEGSAVGITFHTLLVEQFKRSRDSDRFWWENPDMSEQVQMCNMSDSSLANIVMRNTVNVSLPQNIWTTNGDVFNEVGRSKNNTTSSSAAHLEIISILFSFVLLGLVL